MGHSVTRWYILSLFKASLNSMLSKYQQLKKKSAATALNTVLASAHIQMT
jgi:hypothetical protein